MNMEVTGNARLGVQQAGVARTGRLGSRAIEAGQAQGARVGSRSGGFFRGVKALASRALDVMTPANVRVQSKAARADAAFGRGIDRAVDALRKGGADGVQTFRDELLTLRKGERALGRGGIDYDATLQQALSNRFSAMPEDSLRKIMITLQSDTLSAVRNELIDGPPREVQALADALADAGLMSPLSSDALARPDALRDLSLFESLALDESARRIDARGAENIDAALEQALGAVGQEAGGVRGAVAYVLPTACEAARHAVVELRQNGVIADGGDPVAKFRADNAHAYGLVKQRLETMGEATRDLLLRYADSDQLRELANGVPVGEARTPHTNAAIAAEIPQRLERLGNTLERQVTALEAGGIPAVHTASAFIQELGEAVDTLRALQRHVSTLGLDGTRASELAGRLIVHLDRVPVGAMKLEDRSNTEIGSLSASLGRLSVEHMNEAIAAVTTQRGDEVRETYRGHFNDFLATVTDRNDGYAHLPAAIRGLQDAAQRVLDVANELGAGIEGQDHVAPFRADLLENAVRAHTSEDLLAALGQMRSEAYVSSCRLFEDAGAQFSFSSRTEQLGRDLYNHSALLGSIAEQIAMVLDERGVPVPERPQLRENARPSLEAERLLRALAGLQVTDAGSISFAGCARPQAAFNDYSIEASAIRLLDSVAQSPFSAANLLEEGFIFNHVLLSTMNEEGGIDADQRQGRREATFQQLLENASNLQIANLRDNLESVDMQNLLGAANLVRFDAPHGSSDEQIYAQGRLCASTESLAVLRVMLGEEVARRELPESTQPRLDIRSREQVPENYFVAIDRAVEAILKLETVEEAHHADAALSPMFRETLVAMYHEAPVGSQRDPSEDGLPGVAGAFSADLGRATMRVRRGDEIVELYERGDERNLSEAEKTARREQGVERLRVFCEGDEGRMLALSRYMNQAALMPLEMALNTSDMKVPGFDVPLGMLLRDGGHIGYETEHLGGAQYRIDYVADWSLRGVQTGGDMVALDARNSRLTFRFSATFDLSEPDQPVIEVGDSKYDLTIQRGMTFSVR